MRWIWCLLLILTGFHPLCTTAAVYHIDSINGSDSTGNGSSGAPYQSLSAVTGLLVSGDEVILYDGNYGTLDFGYNTSDIFTDWVTFRAASGATPELDYFRIVGQGGSNSEGTFSAYINLTGIHILGTGTDKSVELLGPRYVVVDDCLIEVEGPWTGSDTNIEKTGFYVRGAYEITLQNSEITRVGTGIQARGVNIHILNNHIHDITHDGIRSMGLENSLVEGNLIHGLDDGVEDGEATWNRHCDAIHVFIQGAGSAELLKPNSYVTYRGNIIYDIESQGVQFNNYAPLGQVWNNNLTFENNVFGPVGAYNVFNNADPVTNLIFRGNTIVYIDGGTSYTSPYTGTGRTIYPANHNIAFSASTTGLQVYNNILHHSYGWPTSTATVFDYNLIQNYYSGWATGGNNTIAVNTNQFVDPGAIDGVLVNTSPAINAATTAYAMNPTDIYGTLRESNPDIGAVEMTDLGDLIGKWDFETDADDTSPYGNDGSEINGATYSTDYVVGSHALSLDGTNDYVEVADTSNLTITGDLTLAAFIKPATSGINSNILAKSFNEGYRLAINSSNNPRLILGIPGSGPHQVISVISSATISSGTWQHLAATVTFSGSSGTVRFYLDGTLASTHTISIGGIENGAGDLLIGTGSTTSERFAGLIDDARVYSRALDASEIASLYAPLAIHPNLVSRWSFDNDADDVVGSNHGTEINGATYSTDSAENSHSLSLDGIDDYVEVSNSTDLTITDDITLSAYIKPSTGGTTGNIVAKSFNDGYRLLTTSSGNLRLILGIPNSGAHQVTSVTSSSTVSINTWQHVACTVTFSGGSGTVRFYLDGSLVSSHSISIGGIENGSGNLLIGSGTTSSERFPGLIDDVRIFNAALSDSEISAL